MKKGFQLFLDKLYRIKDSLTFEEEPNFINFNDDNLITFAKGGKPIDSYRKNVLQIENNNLVVQGKTYIKFRYKQFKKRY